MFCEFCDRETPVLPAWILSIPYGFYFRVREPPKIYQATRLKSRSRRLKISFIYFVYISFRYSPSVGIGITPAELVKRQIPGPPADGSDSLWETACSSLDLTLSLVSSFHFQEALTLRLELLLLYYITIVIKLLMYFQRNCNKTTYSSSCLPGVEWGSISVGGWSVASGAWPEPFPQLALLGLQGPALSMLFTHCACRTWTSAA